MSMSDRDGTLWLDGQYIPWRTANTHVLTHSLHYGMAVFEGVRAYQTAEGTALFRLREHTERLLRSAHILQIPVPFTLETLMEAQCQVVAQNHLKEGYIRPLVYLGSEKMGVSPRGAKTHVAIAAWPWGAYLGEEALQQGIRVKVSSYTRHHPNITLCKAKASGNYMNSILANNEATADGYDEALLLDVEGFVAEGSGENLFMVKRGVLYTPDLSSALEGITRDSIIQLAQERGITVLERRISRDELYTADEVFFTGTAAEVTPIREIDRRVIGQGTRGPLTEKLQSAYFDCVKGRAPSHRDWLTFLGD
ncbi:branched-chain amino acid transaminase [Ferrovum myxofaciens]|jgi:branched-chain amino acid aminotransferase|uniref:Branched-chain-amino-acid aminotransferase n=2 Tax=root TaxID=1 RepID=A0A859A905_9PROT|nr:branched-chain amino acid transaminase [Ferrovum myxofaciens]NDU89113.1 branched-chain amino acid transaminase [Ferrovum sp.]KXW58618.1 branched-chain-amino-acid aminotransferase [Ferrovum myxofaciens]MBU6994150.1 branched-chain amino acid transaminase [Ferrovum myxofaciens]QKE38089.1 MAG: branched-chain amino acid transaminase [Ferrovum myxofaciens]QWY75810.1 MAG: branched-chain amino acid transaminase [Ferrovum myxofaciens]